MSFPRYPQYKDSGVEWLGEVPGHWEVKRLTAVCEFQSGKAHEQFIDDDGEYICVNSRFVSTEGLSRKFCTANFSPAKKNDILMVMSDLPNGRALAKAFFVDTDGPYAVNQRVCILSAFNANPRFLFYFLNRNPLFLLNDDGINQTHLSNAVFTKFSTLIPTLPEQTQIATFLDRETAKIDALVAEQRRLMALLKEKRQAVISHTVTRGLNPEGPMKRSGIEWLGDVPEHWETACLTRVASRIVVGIAEAATHAYADSGVPILRSTNIRAGRIRGEILFIDQEFADERGTKLIHAGDLVTVRTGNAGVTAVVPSEFDGCQCFTMLITSLNDDALADYYCYWMNSVAAQCYFSLEGWGTAQVNISVPILKSLPIPIPPLTEQRAIIAFLDSEVAKFDTLTTEAQRAIDLLQERRTALISAAVTGQIDVRGVVQAEFEKAVA